MIFFWAIPDVLLREASNLFEFPVALQNIPPTKATITGEINLDEWKDKFKYCLIGHSKRRKYLNETNELVNLKISLALKNGLISVVCIGEHNRDDDYLGFLKTQFEESLGKNKGFIHIAYEPVWAIGKKATTPEEIKEFMVHLCKWTKNKGIEGNILYGGSVNSKNCKSLLSIENLDGFLIGNASLTKEFIKIIEKVQ